MAYSIELVIMLIVIVYQIYHSLIVLSNILDLRKIFNNLLVVKYGFIEKKDLTKKLLNKIVFLNDDDKSSTDDILSDRNIVKISITETSGDNLTILRIKRAINTYLLNNYGAVVNFSIIKDIIDREVDVKDEEISQSITTPLYLGLAATMAGIIFGLFAMPDLSGDQFSSGIGALINGVKLAMIASLTGLLCTTILSSFFYKNAKRKILQDKNEQISYLQAELLPELLKAEDTGVSGLKASLDRFAREASKIAENVNNAALQTSLNIAAQQDVISKIEKMDMTKVSKANLELFDRLDTSMGAFNHFAEFLTEMRLISDNLKEFGSRTSNINNIIGQVGSSLEESRKLSIFLTTHFQKIEAAGSAALKAVDLSDSHFKDAIELLTTETNKRISNLNTDANNNESKLTEIYIEIGKKLEKITSEHLAAFNSAYSNAIPQFGQLDNLKILPDFQQEVAKNILKSQSDSNANTIKLNENINKLNISLNTIKNALNNTAILSKLDAIEKRLKKGKASTSKLESEERENGSSSKPPGFIKRAIKFILGRKNKEDKHEEE
jgi:hypothetical protein